MGFQKPVMGFQSFRHARKECLVECREEEVSINQKRDECGRIGSLQTDDLFNVISGEHGI
jgi:hypothetical protein